MSTRCTFILNVGSPGVFESGEAGDRVELYEQRDGRLTGMFVTARILSVARIAPSSVVRIPRLAQDKR